MSEEGIVLDQDLLTFVTVIEKESFTKAAEELYISQSAVSLKIKGLEKKYRVKLFDRTNRFIRLTKAGEILYAHAKEILNQYDRAERVIDDLYFRASGPLYIGSSYTFGEYMLPEIIAQFKAMYPEITPNISIRNSKRIATQVIHQDIDIGILEGEVVSPDLTVTSFAQDEMVVIVPANHRLARKKEVDFTELQLETWILREKGSGTREVTDRIFLSNGFTPSTVMEFGSSQVIKEAVQRGLGISIISEWLIYNKVRYDLLVPLKIKNYPIKRDIHYVTNNTQLRTKATELFIQFLDRARFPTNPNEC